MPQPPYDPDLVDLIGPVYDTVLEPTLWPDVLERIRRRFQFQNAAIAVSALPRGETVARAVVGISPEFLALGLQHSRYLADAWGGAARLSQVPLEEPILHSQIAAGTNYRDNPYYTEVTRPQGINEAVAIWLARDRTALGSLALGRHESAPPVTPSDLDGLRFLAPHIVRAVTISRLLDGAMTAAATFEAALEVSQRAVVLVRDDLTIVFANAAGETMLKARDPIALVGDRLIVRHELVPGQLRSAVAAAAREEQMGRRGMALPVQLADGTPLALHVMPLRLRRVRTDFGRDATAAIFIAEPGSPPALPADALALIYGLTPAETRVLELLVEGSSTQEMADALGIATGTVRTHLLAAFEKTGRHSRAELVRLAREYSPPS